MKKLLSILLLLTITLSLLVSCSDDDAPEGMQLVRGGSEYGYNFYAPEEWTLSSVGNIAAAYASKVDPSSVSYTETTPPQIIGEVVPGVDPRIVAVHNYFTASMQNFAKAPTMIKNPGEVVTFGNAELAIEYIYEHEYSQDGKLLNFRTLQIFVYYSDRFGIFTFTSPTKAINEKDKSQFDFYAEKINRIKQTFEFIPKAGDATLGADRERDAEGFLLSSDICSAGYAIYLPEEFKLLHTGGMTIASLADGSNITASRATQTGVAINVYWGNRKSELENLYGPVTEIDVNAPYTMPNAKTAFAYEYTFSYAGEVYHVYQVMATTRREGFVFTYTAKEANYQAHLDVINKIIQKVEF